jgi:hypothetical protein
MNELQRLVRRQARKKILELFSRRELERLAEQANGSNPHLWDIPTLKEFLDANWDDWLIRERVNAMLDNANAS